MRPLQPGTEDPNALKDAKTATSVFYDKGKPSRTALGDFVVERHAPSRGRSRARGQDARNGFGLKLRQEAPLPRRR